MFSVEYEKGQLVYLLHQGSYDMKEGTPAVIRLSPDARTVAIASGSSLSFISAVTGETFMTISDIYAGTDDYVEKHYLKIQYFFLKIRLFCSILPAE